MSLTSYIAAFSVALSLAYVAYHVFKKKRMPDANHLSYLAYGLFGLMAGLTLLALIFANAAIPAYNGITGSLLEPPQYIDIKEYTYALAVGGLLALAGGIEKIRLALKQKLK